MDDSLHRLLYQALASERSGQVTRSRWDWRRLWVGHEPADDRPHQLGTISKHGVIEVVGEVERRAGVLERLHIPIPEARRPGQTAVDERLERWSRDRFVQGRLEQRRGTIDALELGQENENFRAQQAVVGLREQIGRDRSGARPFTGRVLRASCGQRSTMAIAARIRRRQPKRLLGKLRRDRRGAAIGRKPRRVGEHARDLGVW
ncbi:MAG TPA: hypothetical protein VF365_06960 [Candidatus Limnocylindria bacterium]